MLAPIIVFAFNRPDSFNNCIESLLSNQMAGDSDLFVYIDGARPEVSGEKERVDAVIKAAKSIEGFKSVDVICSNDNKGLGPSVIAGVTDVINRFGKVIVIEDDLYVSSNCLLFLNKALDRYEYVPEVFSVCGYTNKVTMPKGYPFDAYFCPRSSSWGWGTWKDRWNSCDWQLKEWSSVEKNAFAFNRWGGSDCYKMLRDWKNGFNKSWAIRFCYNQFVQNKQSLFPVLSQVRNDGFDGSGTNCGAWSRFKSVFDSSSRDSFRFPESVVVLKEIRHRSLIYHSIWMRAVSRFMNVVKK